MPFSDWCRRAPCVMTSRSGGVAIRAWPGHARSSFGRTGSFREARTAKRSQHAGGPELGLSQDVRHPAETLREVPPRPGAEADRRVRAAEQARGVEGQVHAGQDPQGRPRAADAGREGPAPAVRRQRPAAAAGPHRGAGRGQDEAGLHPGAEDRGLPGEAPADAGLQAGPGQVHPPRARAHPPAPHQGAQAGGEHPVLHRAPGLPEAHRLLPALALRRGPARPREEEERQEGPGRGGGRRRRGGGLSLPPRGSEIKAPNLENLARD